MDVADLPVLLWATAILFVPGAGIVLALRRISPVTALAAAPAVSFGVFYLAAVVGPLLGLPFGTPLVLGVWALSFATAVFWGRRSPRRGFSPGRPSPVQLVGACATAAAVALGVLTWLHGIGGLRTLPQEHDVIVHTQLVARITMTGEGAPWQSLPGDLLTGEPRGFYPNGFHLYGSLVSAFGADAVVSTNGATVALLGVALPAGVAALGLLLRPALYAPLMGGAAALLSVAAYRPMVALMHDGGILPNAGAFAVTPGAVALLLVADRMGPRGALPIGLLVAGSVVLHPTSAVTIGVTAGVWLVVVAARPPIDRARLRALVTVLGVGALIGAVALVPFALAGTGRTTTTASQLGVVGSPRGFAVQSFPDAVALTFAAPYGGFFDNDYQRGQVWLAVLMVIGVAVCLFRRLNGAFLCTFGVWAVLLMLYLVDVDIAPLRTLTGLYYQSYLRLSGTLAPLQWLAGGIAVAALVEALVRLARQVATVGTRQLTAAVAGALVTTVVVLLVSVPYARVNVEAIAQRYKAPRFERVDRFDLAAAAYVAERIRPGERVMNNANDGSSYGYVFYGLPIVVNTSLGLDTVPYTGELLQRFDDLDEDEDIQDIVCDLGIAWAIADRNAPRIGSRRPWTPGGSFSTAPGLQDLDGTEHVEKAAVFGNVSVYRVDRQGLGCPDGVD